jgi:putative membrane protein
MVVDGIFFWCLVLDPRDRPPARYGFATRLITVVLVMFPQIAMGSYLALVPRDLYAFYDLCGRLYPSIGALADQHLGGLLVWIPASMMSSVAFLLTLNHLRIVDDNRKPEEMTEQERQMAAMASRWTGR